MNKKQAQWLGLLPRHRKKPIGKGTLRALYIIDHRCPPTPKDFAKAMWPNSPKWRQTPKCKNNGSGGGMALSGGGFIARLKKRGLVEESTSGLSPWKITGAGRYLLVKHHKALKDITKDIGR